jgi:hypothetical protein
MRAEIKAGELLRQMKARGQRTASKDTLARGRKVLPREAPTLSDLGVNKTQSSRWQRLAALPQDAQEAKIERAKQKANAALEPAPIHGVEGTGEFERYTPPEYIEAAREVLGEIDLDPATCELPQEWIKAAEVFTIKTNGLSREWHGRVWLNPPYHRLLMPKFINKLVGEIDAGRVTAAILLTNNYTDTDSFLTAANACSSLCFTHVRIDFLTPANKLMGAPTQGQVFFYYGKDVQRFEDVFCRIGVCFAAPSRAFEG